MSDDWHSAALRDYEFWMALAAGEITLKDLESARWEGSVVKRCYRRGEVFSIVRNGVQDGRNLFENDEDFWPMSQR